MDWILHGGAQGVQASRRCLDAHVLYSLSLSLSVYLSLSLSFSLSPPLSRTLTTHGMEGAAWLRMDRMLHGGILGVPWEGRCTATWREAGSPNHHDDKVGSDR